LGSETKDEEEFNLEFQLFLVSSILASDSFIDFDRFKELVDKSKLSNLDILAILDTHYKTLMKHLPKSYRKNATLNSIHKKLRKRIQTNPDFADEVNKPINKRKLE
jgi:hypothetical protein